MNRAAIRVLGAGMLLLWPHVARAQTRVTLCESDTQTGPGTNLSQALAQGGAILFDCPGGTATVRLTRGHGPPGGTSLDGGGRVTLDAHGTRMTMFWVPQGSLSLRGMTIRNVRQQRSTLGRLPSVVYSAGELTLEDVTIEASESPVLARGRARVLRSRFLGNTGWAVNVNGEGSVEQSSFIGNATGLAIDSGTVRGSLFSQHTAGALRVSYPRGELHIVSTTFERNTGQGALVLSQRAARDATGIVTVSRCTFRNNVHDTAGGAITIHDTIANAPEGMSQRILEALRRLPPARFVFRYSRFEGNRGKTAGAIRADLANTHGVQIRGGIFLQNTSAESGGAISWEGRSMLVTHSVFRQNTAAGSGSALYARLPEPGVTWTVANSLIAENAGAVDGAAVDAEATTLINVTIARNRGYGLAKMGGQAFVTNTILSENSGGNCRDVAAGIFRGPNLQHGAADCPGVTSANPELDAMYAPGAASPARGTGDVATCRTAPVARTDLLFQSRGVRPYCALGAFERPPVRRAPKRRG